MACTGKNKVVVGFYMLCHTLFMKQIGTLLGCTALAFASVPATAADAPLKPIKPWVLDYGETNCSASRMYGSEAAPTFLAFRPSPSGTVMQIIIARPGRISEAQHFPTTVAIGGQTLKTTALDFGVKDKGTEVFRMSFDRQVLTGLGAASDIAVRVKGRIEQSFAIPSMAKVLEGLDKCTADFQKYWNIGEEATRDFQQQSNSVQPLTKYFSYKDYPGQAVFESLSGNARMTMMIDEKGAIKGCMEEETSGIATLDAMTCIVIMQRAKFTPAIDAAGKPVRSTLTTKIKWVMP